MKRPEELALKIRFQMCSIMANPSVRKQRLLRSSLPRRFHDRQDIVSHCLSQIRKRNLTRSYIRYRERLLMVPPLKSVAQSPRFSVEFRPTDLASYQKLVSPLKKETIAYSLRCILLSQTLISRGGS